MRKHIAALSATFAFLLTAAFTVATPSAALAGRSACPQGSVCGWNDANWVGTQITFWPSDIYQATPSHCLNFDRTASQDRISSLASYNGAPGFVIRFFTDINCYAGPYNTDYYDLYGTNQVANLQSVGFNDKFSSVMVPNCC